MSDELREAAVLIHGTLWCDELHRRFKDYIEASELLASHYLAQPPTESCVPQADLDKLQDYTSPPLKRVGTITGKFTPAEPEGGRE